MEPRSTHKSRAYQLEMLEQSLRQNTIVTMDTGSGKTQIAILRIREELNRCSPEKLVWFLVPTVVLAQQQHAAIELQLPAFQSRVLSGNDGVDHWSTQHVWDKILHNIRIVVSTPQVLLDALYRSFVVFNRLALIVFDEAHLCVQSSATNLIMKNYYHRFKNEDATAELPAILGLTASPVEGIEHNLDSICKSPVTHREELLEFVNRPEVISQMYQALEGNRSETLKSLDELVAFSLVNIEDDPYIKSLRMKSNEKNLETLSKVLSTGKTWCGQEVQSLARRATTIHNELGPWAADVFIRSCCERFAAQLSSATENIMLLEWDNEEKIYMGELLSRITHPPASRTWGSQPDALSEKADKLVKILTESSDVDQRVIIFAKERTTVVMLAHLLSTHPLTEHLKIGHFLGNSNFAGRRSSIYEFSHRKDQKGVIDDLRTGKKNILVATAVLEMGIDVSACNIVICYDTPANLTSFIQRRGRAREKQSKFYLFIEQDDKKKWKDWNTMEAIMRREYLDDARKLEEIKQKVALDEHSAESFIISATGAQLTYDNARPYLEHFCSTLVHDNYTDNRPDFSLSYKDDLITAKVVLPNLLDPSLREINAKSYWKTERMAKRDASFQTYKMLYHAGLVNDNLVPIHCEKASPSADPEVLDSPSKIVRISKAYDPWLEMASLKGEELPVYQTKIHFSGNFLGLPEMVLLLPRRLPCKLNFNIFWDHERTIKVTLSETSEESVLRSLDYAERFTHTLLYSVFRDKMDPQKSDFLSFFLPVHDMPNEDAELWFSSLEGAMDATEVLDNREIISFGNFGLVRNAAEYGRAIMMETTRMGEPIIESQEDVESSDEGAANGLCVLGKKFPKRKDFLHPIVPGSEKAKVHSSARCWAAQHCTVDRLPICFTKFALFVPSILHKVEVALVAATLESTLLAPLKFENFDLVTTAICASSAREGTDYQRLEFLGDSILKFHTSIHLTAANPIWHEGLLSAAKDRIVSNRRLSKASLDQRLDAYIQTKAFTGIKWKPKYASDILFPNGTGNDCKELSSKVLADVVEALIGASYLDGGFDKSLRCLAIFLPEISWSAYANEFLELYKSMTTLKDKVHFAPAPQIEELIGYTFEKKALLLEALTHPCSVDHTLSYQRLEFLGDSILDHLVVEEVFRYTPELSHQDMHLLRTAVVNADYLAFLCMMLYREEVREEPIAEGQAHLGTVTTTEKKYLWQYMVHSANWDIAAAQKRVQERLDALGEDIQSALEHSSDYPWTLFLQVEADKFFSDLVESILGAIFVDSRGSLDACRQFLDCLGLMWYLRRLLSGQVRVLHPRNRLHEAAGSDPVRIDTSVAKAEGDPGADEGSKPWWSCRIVVKDEIIVELHDGMNKAEVEARAAALAATLLEERRAMTRGKPYVGVLEI